LPEARDGGILGPVTSSGQAYARQSPVTDPGAGSSWYGELPGELGALTGVVRNLVVHQGRVPSGRPAAGTTSGSTRSTSRGTSSS
jgi:hypothetical protein